jgi:NAD(P)-dependent dehydrogenase (short-subunit alcohol dehydrogenase family)
VAERLAGTAALISGGARGMGASHVRRLVAEGAKVVFGDILDDEGGAVAAGLGDAVRYCIWMSPNPSNGKPRWPSPSPSSAESTCW